MDSEEGNNISFSAHGRSWKSSVYVLVTTWLKYVVPKYGTIKNNNFTIYGYGQQMIDENCIFYLLALLLSSGESIVDVKSISNYLDNLSKSEQKCRYKLEAENSWFFGAIENYPILLAHLLLITNSLRAIKYSSNPEIFYPQLFIHGPENSWFVIDCYNNRQRLVLTLPWPLSECRYLRKFNKEDKIHKMENMKMEARF